MRKFGKGLTVLICCMLLAFCFAFTAAAAPTENCPGGCSHEAAIGTTHYDTLAEALSAATDGCTVTVLVNTTVAGGLTVDNAITLDLGSKTLSGQKTDNDTFITVTKDCIVKNGTLTMNVGCTLRAMDCTVTIAKDAVFTGSSTSPTLDLCGSCGHIYGKVSGTGSEYVLSVSDGSLHIYKDATVSSANAHAIVIGNAGRLEITGGNLQSADDLITLNISGGKTLDISITGGTFRARGGETVVINKMDPTAVAPTGFVIGGTFNKVPTDHVPAYCRTTDNGDGTYTVTAQYTITYAPNGGSGSMSGSTADRGTSITLPNCALTAPAGKHFAGWEINGNAYAPGASFAVNGNLNLKALWANHSGGSATCTSPAKCSTCGASYGSTASHALAASGGTPATCTEKGMNSHSRCSTCGQYFVSGIVIKASSLTIPALGHEMKTVEGSEATCTEDGILAHEACALCGMLEIEGQAVTEEQLVVPATGHETEPVAAVASTCTQPGTKAHERCIHCNALFEKGNAITADQLSVPVGTHLLSDWQQDSATHWKTCTGCGEIFRQHSHKDSDADSACDDCGYPMAAPSEMLNAEEEDKRSFPIWIPILAAVIIAGCTIPVAIRKKRK